MTFDQANTRFYTRDALGELAQHLKPGGVFALRYQPLRVAQFACMLNGDV